MARLFLDGDGRAVVSREVWTNEILPAQTQGLFSGSFSVVGAADAVSGATNLGVQGEKNEEMIWVEHHLGLRRTTQTIVDTMAREAKRTRRVLHTDSIPKGWT